MAMFHLSTKPISRKSGRTATASSAYRSGEKIEDKRTGLTHDYTKKTGVVENACFMFKDGEKIKLDRSQVWNKAEETEKRKDSRTAREIVINLPHELDKEQRSKLVAEFAENVAKKYNVAIDYAIHLPDKEGDQRNHHAHIMMTTREVELDKNNQISLGKKTSIELGNKDLAKLGLPTSQEQIKELRADWANMANHHLEMAGITERIDHRSNKDRGINTLPTIKLGWQATAMERRGIQTDKGDYNRQVNATNYKINGLNVEIRFMKAEHKLETLSRKAENSPVQAFENVSSAKVAESPRDGLERITEQNSDRLKNALANFEKLTASQDKHQTEVKPQINKGGYER